MDKKRKHDRFNGFSEDEIKKHTLQDYLEPDLDLVFLGINPSLMAAYRGRYYAGPGNHFYKLLYESGLVPRFVNFEEDSNLLEYKIGLTNIVARATRSSADLTAEEIRDGCKIMVGKMKQLKPKIVIFNGKCIYDVFAEKMKKRHFQFGLQSEKIGNSAVWVVPSSSARCSNFPRMEDKLQFYRALKKHTMFLKGEIQQVDFTEFYFKTQPKSKSTRGQFMIAEILEGDSKETDIMKGEKNPENFVESQLEFLSCHFVRKSKTNDAPLQNPDENLDFVNLIKSRLSQSHEKQENDQGTSSKKLKFCNLMSRKK